MWKRANLVERQLDDKSPLLPIVIELRVPEKVSNFETKKSLTFPLPPTNSKVNGILFNFRKFSLNGKSCPVISIAGHHLHRPAADQNVSSHYSCWQRRRLCVRIESIDFVQNRILMRFEVCQWLGSSGTTAAVQSRKTSRFCFTEMRCSCTTS